MSDARWTKGDSARLDAEIRAARKVKGDVRRVPRDEELARACKAIMAYPLKHVSRVRPQVRQG